MEEIVIPIVSGIVGALIGGSFTLYATSWAFKQDRVKEKENEKQLVKSYLLGIHDEVESLWNLYEANFGSYIQQLNDNEPCERYWAVTQDYFTIYRSNADLLGKVQHESLRKTIITSYTVAKSLIDSIIMNNHLLERFENYTYLAEISKYDYARNMADAYRKALLEFTPNLRSIHDVVKRQKDDLFMKLREEDGVLRLNS